MCVAKQVKDLFAYIRRHIQQDRGKDAEQRREFKAAIDRFDKAIQSVTKERKSA